MILIVEGEKDKKIIEELNLNQSFEILITNGPSDVFKIIKKLKNSKDDIIILADPDEQGLWITSKIKEIIPHAYDATKLIKYDKCIYFEKRKNKLKQKIGIEGCDKEYLKDFLSQIFERSDKHGKYLPI